MSSKRKRQRKKTDEYVIYNFADDREGFIGGDQCLAMLESENYFNDSNVNADHGYKSIECFDGRKDVYKLLIDGERIELVKELKKDMRSLHLPNEEGYYLVHLAVMNNQVEILQELIKIGTELNVVDAEGKTPLHLAIIMESVDIVSILIAKRVSLVAVDTSGQMPMHTAAEIGNTKILGILIPYHKNLNLKAEGGLTPLHLAAINNHGDVVKILIQHGASLLIKDDNGNYPIHSAAKNGANMAIEAIVEAGEKAGISKEQIMSLKDREKNMPIHSAVNSGNIQTVRTCVKVGAVIDSQQEDGSTPVHFVAAQGLIDVAKAMEDIQENLFVKVLSKTNFLKRTPLHLATIFEHVDMMRYLLQKGAKMNTFDGEGRTPLHIAASKGSMLAVKALIDAGAEPLLRDKNKRNFVHLLVLAMAIAPELPDFLKNMKYHQKLIKSKDIYGFTPLHYATKCGHMTLLNDLMKLGSSLTIKSNKKQTILHLAAQFGRYNTCVILLSKPKGASLQNEPDESGKTPLHLAAMCGQLRVVSLLLNKGVFVSKDNSNNTPLHLAASNGRVDCMRTLLITHKNLINMTNVDGNTPLHLAASMGHIDAVVLLLTEGAVFVRNNTNRSFYDEVISYRYQDLALAIVQHPRWEEVFMYLSPTYGSFLIGLVRNLPDICTVVLDRCVTNSDNDPNSEEYYVEYNFSYLNLPRNFQLFAQYNRLSYVPLLPLQEMVRNNRVELLSHPLCINFLRMKWRKYGAYLHFFEMGMYMIYLICLTIVIVDNDPFDHYEQNGRKFNWRALMKKQEELERNNTKESRQREEDVNHIFMYSYSTFHNSHLEYVMKEQDYFCFLFISIFSIANLTKQALMLMIMRFNYISFNLLLEFGVFVTSLIFAFPFLNNISTHHQWSCAALCAFLSWFNCLVNLQRFDLFGIYVVMFLEILKTLVQVVLIFSVLNIAFGLSFYVLMKHEENQASSTPLFSIIRTFASLTEINYLESFNIPVQDGNQLTLHFPFITYVVLILYLFLMPILLMNLLVSLKNEVTVNLLLSSKI